MQIDLKGNIKTIGSVYVTGFRARPTWRIIDRSWAGETEFPWRHGTGWGLNLFGFVLNIGRWAPLDEELVGEVHEDIAPPEEIADW